MADEQTVRSATSRPEDISAAISRIIKRGIPGPIGRIPQKNIVPIITKIIKGAVGNMKTVPKNVISNIFKNKIPKSIVNASRNATPVVPIFSPKNKMNNFIPANKFNGKKPGYVFSTRNNRTGYYKNTGTVYDPEPLRSRNYSQLSLRQLLQALKNYPSNSSIILEQIRKVFSQELRNLRYASGSARHRKLGDILRLLPRNFKNRGNATSMVINGIRNASSLRTLGNIATNLGSVPNENIKSAFRLQQNYLKRKAVTSYGNYGSSYGGGAAAPTMPWGAKNYRFNFRNKNKTLAAPQGGNWLKALVGRTSVPVEAPVTAPQRNAINSVGGVNPALRQVAAVPGGPPEIVKAAEALNLTNGNKKEAMEVHEASQPAIKAVQNLGGSKNALHVVQGLNELASPNPKSVNSHFLKPKYAALNRAIRKIQKKNLEHLVRLKISREPANNKFKTFKKKYLREIVSSNIYKTSAAKKARRASKNRVSKASR
jgi:hypothetical protein